MDNNSDCQSTENRIGNNAATSANKTKLDGKHFFGFIICSFILIFPLI